MIERQFVQQNIKEFEVKEYFKKTLSRVGFSTTKIQRTPLGDKVVIFASRPGLIIGRQGANIKMLTKALKNKFNLDNPQIEINEVENIHLDANIVAESIASALERYGTKGFKGVGHKVMMDVIGAKALGVEILISGKVPSSRARTWRFYMGYLKKCGDIAITGVDRAYEIARLKSGIVGIRVSIMPPTTKLPYHIEMLKEPEAVIEQTDEKDGIIEEMKEKAEKEDKTEKEETKKEEKSKKSEAKVEEKELKKEKKTPAKKNAKKAPKKAAKKKEKK